MPLTFPSHLAPVLPLKLWRPRWFDGVALAAGAVAPDVAYLALDDDGRLFADTHAWPALLWWCLPVAAAYTWVARRSIGTIAAHLPDSRRFTWQAYAALAGHRHRWWITVLSCLLGAASHLAWDRLTHTDGWIQAVFGVRWADVSPIAWWTVSDLASTVLGAAVVLAVAARAGRRSGRERAATGPTTGAAARGGARRPKPGPGSSGPRWQSRRWSDWPWCRRCPVPGFRRPRGATAARRRRGAAGGGPVRAHRRPPGRRRVVPLSGSEPGGPPARRTAQRIRTRPPWHTMVGPLRRRG
ncbi:DUF4184 family protein [Catellatospora coxensis]